MIVAPEFYRLVLIYWHEQSRSVTARRTTRRSGVAGQRDGVEVAGITQCNQ